MEQFEIIRPSPRLAPYVKEYWFLQTSCEEFPSQRLIPNGCVSMIIHRAEPMRSCDDGELQPIGFVGGMTTRFTDYTVVGRIDIVCILFRPYGAAAFISEPMSDFAERNVDLTLLDTPLFGELTERLCGVADNSRCVEIIEQTLVRRLDSAKEYDFRRIAAAVSVVEGGLSQIESLASASCLSTKQFRRIFQDVVGVNPLEFARVVRFQRALHTMQQHPQATFTQVAHECRFADQAHFNREFKLFTGYTPSEYRAVCAPYSDYFD